MPRGGVLSADMCYPDCRCCGASGDLSVTRNSTSSSSTWWCVDCESSFDVGPESPWHGVEELPKKTRRVYIDREIRGLSVETVAQSRHVSARSIPSIVAKAKKRQAAAV